MSDLSLYNSLTKQRDVFSPRDPGKIRIYNCGPTVYKRQHLGNMRRFLFADFLRRTLEFMGYEVREIMNITDVGHLTDDEVDEGEDKLERAAREAKKTPLEIADEQIKLFQEDSAALNIEPAHLYPRASQHIQEMQELIAKLIETGHAYKTDSGVYFAVETFPAYGALSGNKLDQLAAGSRIAVRGDKKHPADFALWKFDDSHVQQWPSPWGQGYPGWHIECSAMALKYLENDIDIHTGGEDNRFPHHENEIAQSEAATGQRFVRLWLHNAHLQLGGKRLAKREGEQLTLDTLREKGFSPLAFRLFVFGAQYRHRVDFSWEAMTEAAGHLDSVRNLLRRLKEKAAKASSPAAAVISEFKEALEDDLNTPRALAVFLSYIRHLNDKLDHSDFTKNQASEALATLKALDQVLGVIKPLEEELANATIPPDVQKLATEREEARKQKNFTKADELREQAKALGYTIEDTPQGQRVYKSSPA